MQVTTLIKRDSEKHRVWIQETLPKIYQKKIEAGWRIFYQDDSGIPDRRHLGVNGQQN
jgi:hypothetical protein